MFGFMRHLIKQAQQYVYIYFDFLAISSIPNLITSVMWRINDIVEDTFVDIHLSKV